MECASGADFMVAVRAAASRSVTSSPVRLGERRGSWLPRKACHAINVTDRYSLRAHVDHAEHDRQLESARPDRAGVEHRDAAFLCGERDVRVTAHHERRIFGTRDTCNVGTEPRSVHGNVCQ